MAEMRTIGLRGWLVLGGAVAVAFAGAEACTTSGTLLVEADGGADASGSGSGSGSSGASSGSGSGSGSPDSGGSSSGDAGHSVGGIPGGAIGPGTTLSGCQIFPNDNPWNVAIDGPEVQVIHTYDAHLPQGTALHADFGDYTTNHYGIPYEVVPATQAELPTTFSLYANQSDPGPGGWVGPNPVTTNSGTGTTAYPFFVGMKIEGDPPGGGTPGSLPGDQHGIVLEQAAAGGTACKSFEAWNCVPPTSSGALCANGAVFDLTSNALRPAGWTSGDLAGLSILAGTVKLSEVQVGTVTHAIRVTFNDSQSGYIPPATHALSSGSAAGPLGSAYPPMGLRLRLKASVVTTGYSAPAQTVMAAMKKYGLIVADKGSDWYFQGDSDDGWNKTAPDGKDTLVNEVGGDCGKLKGSDFEAVYSGAPVSTGL
jgi:hypothetical protein